MSPAVVKILAAGAAGIGIGYLADYPPLMLGGVGVVVLGLLIAWTWRDRRGPWECWNGHRNPASRSICRISSCDSR